MDHERRLHGTLGAKQVHQQPTGPAHIYMCEYCHEKFPKKRVNLKIAFFEAFFFSFEIWFFLENCIFFPEN